MKIQFLFSTSIALLQASPSLSAGVRYGHLATDFDEFLQKARSNNTYKQCKKSCSRNFKTSTRAFSDCIDDCKYSYEDWDYFPTGGQCSKSCKVDSDCQKGGFNPCGSCGKYEGTEMYRRCYAPKPGFDEDTLIDKESVLAIEADETPVDPAKKLFLAHSGNTCGRHCHKDSDCFKGGFVECGTCNKVHGTQGYHTCIDTSTPAPTPWNYFPEGGQCSKHCTSDSDCQKGGFNPCGSCGLYQGTEMYHKCYAPQPE